MANVMRNGRTPQWGVYDKDDLAGTQGIILDAYNYSVEVKEYEQLDETGRVVGWMAYDQTVNFDMSGTLLYSKDAITDAQSPAWSCDPALEEIRVNQNLGVAKAFSGVAIHTKLGGVNKELTNPTTAIVKNFSVNTSQGAAATFSLSGTIYDFSYTGASC